MIKLYTDADKVNSALIALSVDSALEANAQPEWFDETCEEIMLAIDNAVFTNKARGEIRTPFGLTTTSNLSSGCKAVLLIYFTGRSLLPFTCINVTECGVNALKLAFLYADTYNVPILLQYVPIGAGDWDILVNDEFKVSTEEEYFDIMTDLLW